MPVISALAGAGGTFWMPPQRSTVAGDVDALFYLIYWICVFFFLLILALAVGFLLKYRRRGEEIVVQKSSSHSTFTRSNHFYLHAIGREFLKRRLQHLD
jgi:heme/copper-type cytochrome/quinol oxidase subunit 2